MPYIVGYSQYRNRGPISEATCATATEALRAVHGLQASDETIRYIKAPYGGEIGIGELERDAELQSK